MALRGHDVTVMTRPECQATNERHIATHGLPVGMGIEYVLQKPWKRHARPLGLERILSTAIILRGSRRPLNALARCTGYALSMLCTTPRGAISSSVRRSGGFQSLSSLDRSDRASEPR